MTRVGAEGTLVVRGILSVDTRTVDGRAGVIVGDRQALAVDAGIDADEGARVAAAVRSAGRKADLLLYTHGHDDHVLGGTAFRGGLILAHADTAADIRGRTAGRDVALPNIVFSGELSLDLGDRWVRVLPTPGHSPGAVCVFVPDARVLFGGDTVVVGIPPVFRDGSSRMMQSSLRALAVLDVDALVPGHGPIVRGAERVREAILWSANYLGTVRERVAARLGRDEPETIVKDAAPFEVVVGDRLPRDRHRMVWRHEQTVRGILAELTAEGRA